MLTAKLFRKRNARQQREPVLGVQKPETRADSDPVQDADHTASAPEAPQDMQEFCPATSSWKVMVIIMLALAIPVFLETLDYTVVATAQVHIASVFNRLDLQSYIGTVYLLTSTVFLPPFASIADIFGRHSALQVSLLFFMVGSAISIGSQNMQTMLAGRGVAGIGAAGLLAAIRIILTDSGSLSKVNWQQSILFALYTVGYCTGPFIGGELVSVSFRWIFAINLPSCAIAMILSFMLLRGRTKGPQPTHKNFNLPQTAPYSQPKIQTFFDKVLRIDWIDVGLFMAGGILLLLALNWGSTERWNLPEVIACFVVGGLLLVASLGWEYFLEQQGKRAQPSVRARLRDMDHMILLDVFQNRNTCIVYYGTFVNGMVMLVMFYFVAIFFVIVSGDSATHAGAQLIYFAPGIGGGSLIAIQIIRATRQPKYAIFLGSLVSVVALGLISMGMDQNNEKEVNGFMAMAGVGTGLSIGPLAVQARFSQPEQRNAVVSALMLFFRSFGGTIGLAQCGAVLNGRVTSYLGALVHSGALGSAGAGLEGLATGSGAGLGSLGSIDALPAAAQGAVRAAFRQGSHWAFVSLVPWAVVAALAVGFLTDVQEERPGAGAEEGAGGERIELGRVQDRCVQEEVKTEGTPEVGSPGPGPLVVKV